jgi:hypothetical protein
MLYNLIFYTENSTTQRDRETTQYNTYMQHIYILYMYVPLFIVITTHVDSKLMTHTQENATHTQIVTLYDLGNTSVTHLLVSCC